MFQRLGVPTHDSDFAVHQLYNSPEFAYKVKQAFPYDNVCIMHPSNLYPVVSRKLLGEVVYNDTEKLKKLESIVHPIVEDRQKAFLARCRRAGSTLVVLDVPLLF
jgi:dephospho-CoA kinase